MKLNLFFILLSALAIVACSNSDSSGPQGETAKAHQNRLDWDSIPAQFNPETFEENFQLGSSNKIDVNMFGFKDDVEILYSNTLATGQGYLKLYSVRKDGGSRGQFNTSVTGSTLKLNRYGSYECEIRITDGHIAELKGLCFVRLQIVLPMKAEIEVYNIKQLISKRFFTISTDELIQNIHSASFKEGKNAAINDYLASYTAVGKTPQMVAEQLGLVVHEFTFKDEKFAALKQLQMYAIDRQNLNAMIEKEFSFFDREEAKKICGL